MYAIRTIAVCQSRHGPRLPHKAPSERLAGIVISIAGPEAVFDSPVPASANAACFCGLCNGTNHFCGLGIHIDMHFSKIPAIRQLEGCVVRTETWFDVNG